MSKQIEALKLALEALEAHADIGIKSDKAIAAIKEALAEQPAQRKPLTDEELYKVFPAIATYTEANKTLYRSIARAIEAKLKEKNG